MNKLIISLILTLIFIINVNSENLNSTIFSNWMYYIDGNLKLNQINISGTHDSCTRNIGKIASLGRSVVLDKILTSGVCIYNLFFYP